MFHETLRAEETIYVLVFVIDPANSFLSFTTLTIIHLPKVNIKEE